MMFGFAELLERLNTAGASKPTRQRVKARDSLDLHLALPGVAASHCADFLALEELLFP